MRKILLIFLLFFSCFLFAGDLFPVKVAYVIDGDTYKIWYQGKKKSVRLIGIDTPESRKNRRAELQSRQFHTDIYTIIQLGRKAKNFAQKYIKKGQTIYLEFDVQKFDRYGRILAYVWLDREKEKMMNEILVKEGYAVVYTVPPNVKYQGKFLQAQREAREKERGLWGDLEKEGRGL